MSAPFRYPRFFVTSPSPCPYIPGRHERKVFTELVGPYAIELNDALSRIGFRRSQGVAYRPSCIDCQACTSVRVITRQFKANATQRKTMRRHADLEVSACRPWSTDEQFDLMSRYLAARHPLGGMSGMDEIDYADMVEHTPVNSHVVEYREPAADGRLGRLVACCITDEQADGLSLIYSFYDAAYEPRPGLGTFVILDHIRRAAEGGLPYVYLGYWIQGSRRMAYKANFRPLERLTPAGWRPFDPPKPGEERRRVPRESVFA